MNRNLEFYFFSLETPSFIDWNKKECNLRNNIDTLLFNFNYLDKLNFNNTYFLENISKKNMKKIIIDKHKFIKEITFITFQLESNKECDSIKQGVILFLDRSSISKLKIVFTNIFNIQRKCNNFNYLFLKIEKNSKIKLKKINIIKNILNNKINQERLKKNIKFMNCNNKIFTILEILSKSKSYSVSIECKFTIVNKNIFFLKKKNYNSK